MKRLDRCVEWIGKRSRRKIGRAIDFFPLTGNKPPSQTVAPLCFEASVNLPGFLAAAVIRNLARINRSYKSLFLSRFSRTGRGWSPRKHGRTGAGNVSLFRNRIETCDYSVASSAETGRWRKNLASLYIYLYVCVCVRWRLLSEIIRAAIGFSRICLI